MAEEKNMAEEKKLKEGVYILPESDLFRANHMTRKSLHSNTQKYTSEEERDFAEAHLLDKHPKAGERKGIDYVDEEYPEVLRQRLRAEKVSRWIDRHGFDWWDAVVVSWWILRRKVKECLGLQEKSALPYLGNVIQERIEKQGNCIEGINAADTYVQVYVNVDALTVDYAWRDVCRKCIEMGMLVGAHNASMESRQREEDGYTKSYHWLLSGWINSKDIYKVREIKGVVDVVILEKGNRGEEHG